MRVFLYHRSSTISPVCPPPVKRHLNRPRATPEFAPSNDGLPTDYILAWRANRTIRSAPAFSSSGSVRSLTKHFMRYGCQRVHDRIDHPTAAAMRRGVSAREDKSDADTDAKSDQSHFAGVLSTVFHRLPVLFIQTLVRLLIYLAGLPLRLIYNFRSAFFDPFAHGVSGITQFLDH